MSSAFVGWPHRVLLLVDAVTAEQQQMDANRKCLELNQEMLAPRSQRYHGLAQQPLLVNLAVPFHANDRVSGKVVGVLAQDDDTWPFRHLGSR